MIKSVNKNLFGVFNMVGQGTVTPVQNGHSKIDKTKFLKTNGSLMTIESIAECILQYF